MPKWSEADVTPKHDDGVCGPVKFYPFSDAGGLTQFGAALEILPPGSRSSIKHWHATEDELVYVVEGHLTLHEGDQSFPMGPGDTATFKAGATRGHCLENTGNVPSRYLIVGTRNAADIITYPDHDRVLTRDASGAERWTDTTGQPARNPYAGKG